MIRFVPRRLPPLAAAGAAAVVSFAPGCIDRSASPQQPPSAKVSTVVYRARWIHKLDLLLVLDNSPSMADKQDILAEAVPDLVRRLVSPGCVAAGGQVVDFPGDKCPQSHPRREGRAIHDIHIGVISSSIRGHGADSCAPGSPQYNPRQEDLSHLIERADPADPTKLQATWAGKGFLSWHRLPLPRPSLCQRPDQARVLA